MGSASWKEGWAIKLLAVRFFDFNIRANKKIEIIAYCPPPLVERLTTRVKGSSALANIYAGIQMCFLLVHNLDVCPMRKPINNTATSPPMGPKS